MTYPGGKGGCFRQIINRMPPHRVYIETHLGGGSVLLNKRPAEYSIGIDVDGEVIASWRHRQNQRAVMTAPTASDSGAAAGLQLVCADSTSFLSSYDWQGDELVYADPPYVMSARATPRRYYRHEYTDADHRRLLDVLLGLPCAVMVSGYRSALYDQALAGWRREDFTSSTRRGRAVESVWMNYEPATLHDYRHLGGDYRERERIKRKLARWRARFASLPPSEREAMLRALLEAVPSDVAVRAFTDTHGGVDGGTASPSPQVASVTGRNGGSTR